MRTPVRKAVAVLLCAAVAGAAWAGPPAAAGPNPAEAMAQMRAWGVYSGDGDVLKSYLGDERHLTDLGKALYESLSKRYSAAAGGGMADREGLAEDVLALKPSLDKLRELGPYDQYRQQSVQRTLDLFKRELG